MNKHIFFYSNFCPFSKEVLMIITKRNIQTRIMCICVDETKYVIPKFVDRVPTIVEAETKNVYTDDKVIPFIENIALQSQNKPEVLTPYSGMGYKDGCSDVFSYLGDENAYNTLDYMSRGYSHVSTHEHIDTPKDMNNARAQESERSGKMNISMDRILEERNAEIQKIIGHTQPHPAFS